MQELEKGKKMFKCTIDKGVMTFKGDDVTYTPGGQIFTDVKDIVTEYNLVMVILKDHGWAFPVVEALNRRSDALKQNLMDLFKGKLDGWNIQHTEDDKAASVSGGKRSSSDAGGNSADKTKKGTGP